LANESRRIGSAARRETDTAREADFDEPGWAAAGVDILQQSWGSKGEKVVGIAENELWLQGLKPRSLLGVNGRTKVPSFRLRVARCLRNVWA